MPLDKLDSLGFSPFHSFSKPDLATVPDTTGVYAIYEGDEVVYVGMAGRDGKASLRWLLLYHFSGQVQVADLFAQHVLFGRVLYQTGLPRSPKEARHKCREYIRQECRFRFLIESDIAAALRMEEDLISELKPTANLTLF